MDNEVQKNRGFTPVDAPQPCISRTVLYSCDAERLVRRRWQLGFPKLVSKVSVDNADAVSKFSSPNLGRHTGRQQWSPGG
jgi:hypothetical protein